MKPHIRVIVSVIAWFVVSWCSFWCCLTLLPTPDPITQWRIAQLVSILCGIAAAIYTWIVSASASKDLVRCAVLTAFIVGGITFLAGFIGPIIFYPGSNQGPLLGFLFTGPIGFVAGALGGAAYGSVRAKREASNPSV